jgi:predicted nuclease with TOPRIM domain
MPVEPVAVRAEQVEGLREMILEVLTEIEERRVPRELLIDVEALRRSPAGTLIRMENEIQRLSEGQEALWKSLEALRAEMKEGQEALWKAIDDLRAEMKEGQEALRAEFRRELANLESVMEARFAAIDARFAAVDQRFDQLEQRLARTDFWIKFFAGLISALFTAQLVLTFIR